MWQPVLFDDDVHMTESQDRHRILGLPPRVVELWDHTPHWHQLYQEEASLLRQTIGEYLVDIQHVGSTCIPNIKAKPIIDLLGGVISLEQGLLLVKPLGAIEYSYLGDKIVRGHHIFGKGINRSYLFHVVEYQSAAWTDMITFRDILIRNPQIALSYEALKEKLCVEYANDRTRYGDAKTSFIDRVIEENA